MLLIHPPLTKPCEPPAALAYLGAALQNHGYSCLTSDLNIELFHALLSNTPQADDTWSRRAFKNYKRHLEALQNPEIYHNIDKYGRAVSDINRILEIAGKPYDVKITLSNYQDNKLSPLRSDDLRTAAHNYKENIFFPYYSAKIDDLISTSESAFIGLSLNYLSQALCTFSMIGYLKASYPEHKIILGGGLVTTWLSHPHWQNPFRDLVDHFIGGAGEAPLLQLLGSKQRQKYFCPSFQNLNNNYLSPGFILPYTTSYGCFWKKCNFCPETTEGNPYNHVPPATTLSDIKHLVKQTSPTLLHFLDNALSPSTLKALATTPPEIPWYGFARIDNLLANKDFCKQLKTAGCVMLKLGLESGSQAVLDKMNKGISLQLAEKVLTNLAEVGIKTYVYLLFGTPKESRLEAEQTLYFVEQHHKAISFLNLAIFNLPAYSQEITTLQVSDFYEGDLSLYQNFVHPKGWHRGEIRQFLHSTFRTSARISAIMKKDPPFFTSNHAPFCP